MVPLMKTVLKLEMELLIIQDEFSLENKQEQDKKITTV